MVRDALFMLRETVRNPLTASIGTTSAHNARRIARRIDWKTPQTVVEYGGGTGPITRAMLAEMDEHPNVPHRLFVFEIHPMLVEKLQTIRHPKLTVLSASVSDAPDVLARYDIRSVTVIVSGIPLSMLPDADTIIENAAVLLKPQGTMIVYQYTTAAAVLLRKHFHQVSQKRISAMLRLFEAKK